MVMVKRTGLTMVTLASMPGLWVPEDMENWVTWTRSEIDGGGVPFRGAGTLGSTTLSGLWRYGDKRRNGDILFTCSLMLAFDQSILSALRQITPHNRPS